MLEFQCDARVCRAISFRKTRRRWDIQLFFGFRASRVDMRTVLICQGDAPLSRIGMSRWLASWSELAGVIVLYDSAAKRWARVKRQAQRVGWVRMLDVAAFRMYSRYFLDTGDRQFARRPHR